MSTPPPSRPHVIVVMGVAGVGKTTVGRLLAARLGYEFLDADEFHPKANVAKMRDGLALTDHDRTAWLDRLHTEIAAHIRTEEPAVLACSALKAHYRSKLRNGLEGVAFVYLHAPRKLIENRLADRSGHFFNADLLASQFETLEEPVDAIVVDASAPAEKVVDAVLAAVEVDNEKPAR